MYYATLCKNKKARRAAGVKVVWNVFSVQDHEKCKIIVPVNENIHSVSPWPAAPPLHLGAVYQFYFIGYFIDSCHVDPKAKFFVI